MWSVVPESMTHLEETRHVVDLPDSAIAVTEELEDFREA